MALYNEDFIDTVKSTCDIVDVISGYVNLKRHGSTFFGNCPFHREKTASFAVTPEKQIYHCFGCGVGGNVINFIMKIENINFKEAVEFLAEKANIPLPVADNTSESQEEAKIKDYHKNQMYSINKSAGKFFHQNIYNSKIAKDYINTRKLSISTIRKFGIGFATGNNSLYRFLKSEGYKDDDMLATGLIGKNTRGELYDKFKDRLMFPIFDVRGRVIAFGGRAILPSSELKAKNIPKYVNSPENLIYKKGNHLYGLNIAKGSSGKLKRILVVEGYMDVVSPQSFGVTNVVASLGTALTENQGKLLRQYADEVILSYDSDEAGQNAILRGIDILQKLDVICKVLIMENAKDPDEYILKYGVEKFNALIDNSITATEYKIKVLEKQYNLKDTTEKIKFLNKMAIVLAGVTNNIERDIYVEKLSKELGVGKEAIIAEIEKHLFKDKAKEKPLLISVVNNKSKSSDTTNLEESIIYLLTLKNQDVYNKIKSLVDIQDFSDEVNRALLGKVYNAYMKNNFNEMDFTSICENEAELSKITKIMVKDTNITDLDKATDEVLGFFKNAKLQQRKNDLVSLIKNTQDTALRSTYENELNSIIQSSGTNTL